MTVSLVQTMLNKNDDKQLRLATTAHRGSFAARIALRIIDIARSLCRLEVYWSTRHCALLIRCGRQSNSKWRRCFLYSTSPLSDDLVEDICKTASKRAVVYGLIQDPSRSSLDDIATALLKGDLVVLQAAGISSLLGIRARRTDSQNAMLQLALREGAKEYRTTSLRVSGECMQPEIRGGTRILVHLGRMPKKGEIGLIQKGRLFSHRIHKWIKLGSVCYAQESGETTKRRWIPKSSVLGTVALDHNQRKPVRN